MIAVFIEISISLLLMSTVASTFSFRCFVPVPRAFWARTLQVPVQVQTKQACTLLYPAKSLDFTYKLLYLYFCQPVEPCSSWQADSQTASKYYRHHPRPPYSAASSAQLARVWLCRTKMKPDCHHDSCHACPNNLLMLTSSCSVSTRSPSYVHLQN